MVDKLLETIKVINGTALWLQFHNKRLNNSRKMLFNANDTLDLNDFMREVPQTGIYKCRVIYAEKLETIEYSRYQAKDFRCFKLVEADNLIYDFKYLHREALNHLFKLRSPADDILLIKQGFVTDTSIANVAFLYENKWLTPSMPLLKGTTRERLLQEKQIIPATIQVDDLKKFSKMAIMNALLGFHVVEELQLIDMDSKLYWQFPR